MVFETAHTRPDKPSIIPRLVFLFSLFKVVHWQEVRLRVQGQEQDQRPWELRQVSDESYLGQGEF